MELKKILLKLGAKLNFTGNDEELKSFNMSKFCKLADDNMPMEWNVELYFSECFDFKISEEVASNDRFIRSL